MRLLSIVSVLYYTATRTSRSLTQTREVARVAWVPGRLFGRLLSRRRYARLFAPAVIVDGFHDRDTLQDHHHREGQGVLEEDGAVAEQGEVVDHAHV